MLLDANLLLYAVDEASAHHDRARTWLETTVNGSRRVGMPWSSLTGFLRIVTNPRALDHPLPARDAWAIVDSWLDAPTVWVPAPGPGHRSILGQLVTDLDLRANLVPDAVLVALCMEHGLELLSADSDFARFPDLAWRNPLV